jgi:hypothetical protein
MADVVINKFTTQILRDGATPSSPGFVVSEGQDPVNPPGTNNFVPYSGATGTVDLGAQTIEAGSFIKDGGTSSQFLKADGSVDSTAYGTGSVTSVALSMPSAFSVAGTPITTAGTLAVTGAGTVGQYIRGDGSLATFPALTGFVPYTGATADVNLGTHDLAAERGTFTNNGSSDAITVNQTSGSGYGIIVTKGGANEALYVSKTSGSGNAMTVVGGRTSLVDLALSSVTNTAGDFLTLSGGVVHKRTAAETLTDIGGQAALTNPVTGTGTTNYLPKFTGSTTVGNSQIFDNGTNVGIGTTAPQVRLDYGNSLDQAFHLYSAGSDYYGINMRQYDSGPYSTNIFSGNGGQIKFRTASGTTTQSTRMTLTSGGNLLVGTTTDSGYKLDVNGTGRFTSSITSVGLISSGLVRPSSNFAADLGTSTVRWAEIFGFSLNVTSSVTAAAGINAIGQEQAFTWQRTTGTASDIYSLNADSGSAYLYNNTTANILMMWSEGGNVGINNTAPNANYGLTVCNPTLFSSNALRLERNGVPNQGLNISAGGEQVTFNGFNTDSGGLNSAFVWTSTAFNTTTERLRITSGGALQVKSGDVGEAMSVYTNISSTNWAFTIGGSANINGIGTGSSSAATIMRMNRDSGSLRSLNAAGSINASGADYAEYMYKATDDIILKGDVCGVNQNGELTNIFADSISFVVKSTNPSYVGNDIWGSNTEDKDELEIQRQKVDRIAFSGQVPCNVLGASVGDYIIPIKDEEGKISGQAVTKPTLEQYQISVGKVWKIMEDGRAWIAVKIG